MVLAPSRLHPRHPAFSAQAGRPPWRGHHALPRSLRTASWRAHAPVSGPCRHSGHMHVRGLMVWKHCGGHKAGPAPTHTSKHVLSLGGLGQGGRLAQPPSVVRGPRSQDFLCNVMMCLTWGLVSVRAVFFSAGCAAEQAPNCTPRTVFPQECAHHGLYPSDCGCRQNALPADHPP